MTQETFARFDPAEFLQTDEDRAAYREAVAADDPRVPVLRQMLEHVVGEFVDLADGANSRVLDLDRTVPTLLVQLDAADRLRGPIEELKGKHPVVLYFQTEEDATEFSSVVGSCLSRAVLVKV